jgi:hypothetical protein
VGGHSIKYPSNTEKPLFDGYSACLAGLATFIFGFPSSTKPLGFKALAKSLGSLESPAAKNHAQ